MPEIYNLSTLCRCCHSDGNFKRLNSSYRVRNTVEIYETMLKDTLGISIHETPSEVSYTICDKCILKLRQASNFKKQVIHCEQKFNEYCRNEQFLNTAPEFKVEIKKESLIQDGIADDEQFLNTAPEIKVEIKKESLIQDGIADDNVTQTEDNYGDISDYKRELKEDKENDSDVDIDQSEEDPHVKENQENITKEKQTNTKVKQNNNDETHGFEVDTSFIIEKETENGLQYSCKDCGGAHYYIKKLIYRHIFTNHDSLKCKYCDKQLKSFATYENHIRTHFGRKYECTLCDKKYHVKTALNVHMNTHTKKRIFICDICKKTFTTKTVLVRHMIWHQGLNKKQLCEICGRSFNDITNLRIHIRTVHEKLRPFACNICTKTFTAKKHLKAHQEKHTDTKTMYSCELCDRKYSTLQSLKYHKLWHDDIFRCKHCSNTFKGRDTLNNHIITSHNTVFPCNVCDKILSSKNALTRHMNNHSALKRHPCDICGRNFSQKSVMLLHKNRVHNPEKIDKTKCIICRKTFKNIVLHMRSHENRKFSCDMCPKTYSENNTLTRHKWQAHFGRTFDCEVCGKKYLQKSKLKTHKLKIHKLKVEVKSQDDVEQSG